MVLFYSITKKAQIWGMDLFVAVTIFSLGIAFFYFYALNSGNEAEDTIQSLRYDGGVISEIILSEGFPSNWNLANLQQIGILSEGKVDDNKLEMFYNITKNNYSFVKRKLNTPYDFYLFFDENMTINSNSVDGIGKSGFDRNSNSQENLVKINRITIYKEKITGVTLLIWS